MPGQTLQEYYHHTVNSQVDLSKHKYTKVRMY